MPQWLIPIIVNLAIKIGVPMLIKHFPGIPKGVVDIINELLEQLKNPKVSDSSAKKIAMFKVKQCVGVACPPNTVE